MAKYVAAMDCRRSADRAERIGKLRPRRSGTRASVGRRAPQRGAERDQRLGVLEASDRALDGLGGITQMNQTILALERAQDAQGSSQRSGRAPAACQLERLGGERGALLAAAKVVERERPVRASRRIERV